MLRHGIWLMRPTGEWCFDPIYAEVADGGVAGVRLMEDRVTESPGDRWNALSAALKDFHEKAWDRQIRAKWFADALARSLTEYVGIPVGRNLAGAPKGIQPICFYSFRAGPSPEYDTFDLKEDSLDAIGIDAEGFHAFGLGIQLELQPNALPRYQFHWYVRVKLDSERWTCQLGVGDQKPFYLNPPVTIDDLRPIVEATYTGLRTWLQWRDSAEPRQGRIGFVRD